MERIFTYTIPAEADGMDTAAFLLSRSYTRQILIGLKKDERGITVNGAHAGVRRILHTGDVLQTVFSEEASPGVRPVSLPCRILYEDEDLLLADKPADMPVHPSVNNHDNTLANALAWHYQQAGIPFTFRCITRLDRDTTGLVLLAKNRLAASILNRAHATIQKTYLAICQGRIPGAGVIDAPIARVQGSVIARCVDFARGDRALTRYSRLFYDPEKDLSLAHLIPDTGRTHQIRVHMRHIGHPLIGDFLYNPGNTALGRQALHCFGLDFVHPITRQKLHLSSPLPEDMRGCLAAVPAPFSGR